MSNSLWPHGLQHVKAPLSSTVSWSLLRFISIKLVVLSNHLILFCPFPFVFSLFQHQGLFQWVSSSHQVARVLELQLKHQSFQWIFNVDFLWDWLVWSPCSPRDSQESFPAPQFESINSLALSLLYGTPLTPYTTIGKTIALTVWTFVSKVMSLFFNMLSRFVIAFLPRRKCFLISWVQSPSVLILKPKKIQSFTICIVSSFFCHEAMGPDAVILVFWMFSVEF